MVMTQEEKKVLLKDLSARLPYGCFMQVQHCKVECRHHLLGVDTENNIVKIDHCNEFNEELFISNWMSINDCKPYLRPMSSMTDEEKMELCIRAYAPDEMKTLDEKLHVIQTNANNAADFYNEHHIDYRGLIPMGLALEATKNMYKD